MGHCFHGSVRVRGCSLLASLLAVVTGCLTTVQPRPAEIASPGKFTWDVHIPLTTVALGTVRADVRTVTPDEPAESTSLDGPSHAVHDTSGVGTGFVPPWWEFSGKYGLFPGCEVGGIVGILRQGGELRCALVSGDRPLSIAVSAGAVYLPFFDIGGPWFRGGVDVSKRLSSLVLMSNIYVSSGPEARDFGPSVPPEYWFPPLDNTVSHDPGATLRVIRDERRLATTVGLGVLVGDTGYAVIFGFAPYFVLDADPIRQAECERCPRVTVTGLDELFGFAITFGVARLR